MAIQIIVDGYNFIGQQKGLRGNIEARREELIRRLASYRALKGHPVTVVFDAWQAGWPDEHGEMREGVHVVYSRHGEKADQVIGRMARELGSACVVVSSDREVARSAEQAGGVAIRIGEFDQRLREAFHAAAGKSDEEERTSPPSGQKRGNPRKASKIERRKRLRLGRL